MKPDLRFTGQSNVFWAHVRSISQTLGYTVRGKKQVRVPTLDQVCTAMRRLDLQTVHLVTGTGARTPLCSLLLDYFAYRAEVLNGTVQFLLQDAQAAEEMYRDLLKKHRPPPHLLQMNRQKGAKRKPAYLVSSINTLVWAAAGGSDFDHDPRCLTTFTEQGQPVRTLARRVDGAFPSAINPIALWEVKEYYHTTTFGSRVADGVYEILLDGLELQELEEDTGIKALHYLMADAHYTWWECGRSYLCRIVDMLHMRLVDEVLFGAEVRERVPELVADWMKLAAARNARVDPRDSS